MIRLKFGAVLKKLRVRAGLSQEELAEKIFLSRSTVSRLENDKLKLTVEDAIRWGQATQASEVMAAILCGIDITQIMQIISSLPIGAILGGILWVL